MALTRKALKAMGLTDEQVDSIVEMHAETVDGLKEKLNRAEAGAKELPELQKKLGTLESELAAAKKDGWKEKHDSVKKKLDEAIAAQTAKEARAAKEAAVTAYLESKNIKGATLTIAMRGLSAEIDAADLEDGKIKDTKALDELIAGDLRGLVMTTTEKGAPPPATPPANTGGVMTRQQISEIKDRGEKRAAMLANKEIYRKGV